MDYTEHIIMDHLSHEIGFPDDSPELLSPFLHSGRVHKTSYTTCRYCGQSGLKWQKTPSGWRLKDGEEPDAQIHECKEYKNPPSPPKKKKRLRSGTAITEDQLSRMLDKLLEKHTSHLNGSFHSNHVIRYDHIESFAKDLLLQFGIKVKES